MFVITLRLIVLATVALFTVALSVAAAQEAQPNATATAEDDDAALVLAEPDFRVLNLPSTLRLPIRGSSFQLTHRFNGNLRQGSFSENGSNLFGLDQGAVIGFEINVNNGQGTTFAQLARGGFADSLYLGFNLARKFF
jgi:hypothetical protein